MRLKFFFLPLAIMISLVVLFWMAKPEYDRWQSKKKELAAVELEKDKIFNQLKQLKLAYDEYQSKEADHDLINNAIPGSGNNKDMLMAEIYSKAVAAEVVVVTMSVSKTPKADVDCQLSSSLATEMPIESGGSSSGLPAASPGVKCLTVENINLEVAGPYGKMKQFVTAVEKMNRYDRLVSVELAKTKDTNSGQDQNAAPNETLQAKISMDIFSKPESRSLKLISALNNPIGNMLLSGHISKDVIAKYQSEVTSSTFLPVEVEAVPEGREDIFKK